MEWRRHLLVAVLRYQIPLGLNYALTGCPNFNTDIGGFFCGSYNTRGSGSAPRNPQFQELYVRWMQYGLFCPVFRSHGTDCAREVWQFGQAGEPVYDAIVSRSACATVCCPISIARHGR